MADDYTPTTDEVRDRYARAVLDGGSSIGTYDRAMTAQAVRGEGFDRWYEAERRKWQAEAWDEGFTRGFYAAQTMPPTADASESSARNPHDRDDPKPPSRLTRAQKSAIIDTLYPGQD